MSTRTFSEMEEALAQYRQGLITAGELIAALQCDERQLRILHAFNTLPIRAGAKLQLSDLDP